MTQRYADVADMARYLGVTESTLRNRVQRGTIPFIRDEGRIKFDIAEIERHMEKRRCDPKGRVSHGKPT